MRLKPIKPGMVIHCKNDMEYEQLNAEVIKLGYGSLPCKDRANQHIVRNFVFYIETDGVGWEYKNEVAGEITEFSDLIIPELSAEEESYYKGLNDAWELAKKVSRDAVHGGYGATACAEIFGAVLSGLGIMDKFTPQEALAKIEAYEKEQAEIKVGNVVEREVMGVFIVVNVNTDTEHYTLMNKDGRVTCAYKKQITKTGKHIDISAILTEIGKE